MLENYKEAYNKVVSEAESIKEVVETNRIGFMEQIRSIPDFMRKGTAHIGQVKVVFLLVMLKVLLCTLVTVATALALITCFGQGHLLEGKGVLNIQEDLLAYQGSGAGILLLTYVALILLISGVFNGAMGAATYLHAMEEKPTLRRTLDLALHHAPTIWKFRLIQSVVRALTASTKNQGLLMSVAKAAIRVAWKYGTAGMMPAILNGRGLSQAVERSINFIKFYPAKVISLILMRGLAGAILILSIFGAYWIGIYAENLWVWMLALPVFLFSFVVQACFISLLYLLYVDFLNAHKIKIEARPEGPKSHLVAWVVGLYVISTGGIAWIGLFA